MRKKTRFFVVVFVFVSLIPRYQCQNNQPDDWGHSTDEDEEDPDARPLNLKGYNLIIAVVLLPHLRAYNKDCLLCILPFGFV